MEIWGTHNLKTTMIKLKRDEVSLPCGACATGGANEAEELVFLNFLLPATDPKNTRT